ncbi:hypothetical protein EV424DRAFT_1037691 [Suillus variegatus]|nr:hypothetical protein EV424DRAFT_1037691 [Suillus variegatus]
MCGTHTLSPAHNPRTHCPSLSAIPRAILERLSSFFHHPHSDANGPNFSNTPGTPSFLGVLVLSKLLQYRTERNCMLLHGRGRISKGSWMPRARRRNLNLPRPLPTTHLLKVLTLPHQVQQPHSHYPFHCGLISYCFSVVHLHNTPMAYVQLSYPSHLLLILFPRHETGAIMLTVTIKTPYSIPSLES